jgi:hypothetical protein
MVKYPVTIFWNVDLTQGIRQNIVKVRTLTYSLGIFKTTNFHALPEEIEDTQEGPPNNR